MMLVANHSLFRNSELYNSLPCKVATKSYTYTAKEYNLCFPLRLRRVEIRQKAKNKARLFSKALNIKGEIKATRRNDVIFES